MGRGDGLAAATRGARMPETRGGRNKRKRFDWHYDPGTARVLIENQDGRQHAFYLHEVESILRDLRAGFGTGFFPLANNVQKLHDGSERLGLGTTILKQRQRDVTHAQGASYLGVVMEECHFFEWNGRRRGITWRLVADDISGEAIAASLQAACG